MNWRIGEFVFWCHEQVIRLNFLFSLVVVLVCSFIYILCLVLPAKRRQKVRNVLAIEKDQKTAEQYDSTKNTSKTCLNCDDNNWNSEYSAPRMIPDYGEVCNTFHPSAIDSEFIKPLSVLHSGLNHNHSFKEFNLIFNGFF